MWISIRDERERLGLCISIDHFTERQENFVYVATNNVSRTGARSATPSFSAGLGGSSPLPSPPARSSGKNTQKQ